MDFNPGAFVDIRPETNGRIVFLQIPEGKMVAAGTVFAKLNDADLQAQLQKITVQLALATINEQMIIMVDINELISSDEMGLFERQHEAVE